MSRVPFGGLCVLASVAAMSSPARASLASEGCGSTPGLASQPASPPAAQADAAALLADLELPPGSRESATEPREDDSILAAPAYEAASPNLVDLHGWWVAPVGPAELLTSICSHLPSGTSRRTVGVGRSGSGVPRNEFAAFAVRGRAGILVVTVVELPNGSTALRADAEVVWVAPRAMSERFPAAARSIRLVATDLSAYPSRRRALVMRLPSRVASAQRIERVAALLNRLRVAQPGLVHCPEQSSGTVRLTFFTRRDASPAASASITTGGCGRVTVVIAGVPRPSLEAGWPLVEAIGRALGAG